MTPGARTREEILSQTIGWQQAVQVIENRAAALCAAAPHDSGRPVYFTGCGSTYYLALAAAAHYRELKRLPAFAAPASEFWLDPYYFKPGDTLIVISRSGLTSETLFAADAYHAATGQWPITIQCEPEAPLKNKSSLPIILDRAAEQSIAQTRSFASMLVAADALNLLWADPDGLPASLRQLPAVGERIVERAKEFGGRWGPRLDLDRIYFLGSGARYGLACEVSLKMKEMSLSHSEPFHFFEFRHGPKSMVTDAALVVGLVSDEHREQELQVLREMAELGGHVLTLGEDVPQIGDGEAFSFRSGLPQADRPVLYLPPLQMVALERAIAKGLNPDLPRNLDAVVQLSS